MAEFPRIGVAVIISKGNKVLLGKRKNSLGSGTWALTGGHLEMNESFEECAIRETLEETGIKIKNVRFATATNDVFRSENKHYVTIFMLAEYDSGDLVLKEPDKCEKLDWFSWDSLPTPLMQPINSLIKNGFDISKISS